MTLHPAHLLPLALLLVGCPEPDIGVAYPLSPEDRARLVDPEDRDCAPLVGLGRADDGARTHGWMCVTPAEIAALPEKLREVSTLSGREESLTADGCTAQGRAYQALTHGAYCDDSTMWTPVSEDHLLDFQTRCGPLFDAPMPGGAGQCCVWVQASASCDIFGPYP